MKNDPADIELLIEFMSLVSKYGKSRIANVVALLKDHEAIEKTIIIFQEAIELLDRESRSSRGKKEDIMQMDEETLLIGKIIKLLKDKNVFKNIYELDMFIQKYIVAGISAEKRSDKIKVLNGHLITLEHSELKKIYEELAGIVQNKRSVMLNDGTDLSKWSDIILKNKNSREP